MDTIASILLDRRTSIATVLPFVVVLGIVVFVHEFGHYIVARWCGIRSEVFSIGFGPVLWSRRDRRGTLWQVAALPLGGYVKFLGDCDGVEPGRQKALDRLPAAERARELPRRDRLAADADGARGAGLQLPPDGRGLRRARAVAGVPTERPTIARIAALPGVEQPLGRATCSSGRRPAGRRLRGLLRRGAGDARAPEADAGPGRARGEPIDLTVPYALPPLVQGVEPLSPASRAGLKRGDVILAADGGRWSRSRTSGRWCSLGRADDPARGLARRQGADARASRRSSATPTTARAASSGGR